MFNYTLLIIIIVLTFHRVIQIIKLLKNLDTIGKRIGKMRKGILLNIFSGVLWIFIARPDKLYKEPSFYNLSLFITFIFISIDYVFFAFKNEIRENGLIIGGNHIIFWNDIKECTIVDKGFNEVYINVITNKKNHKISINDDDKKRIEPILSRYTSLIIKNNTP